MAEWTPTTVNTIKFTGEYGKLKDMGFKFQKLYASNYMQWHNEATELRVWKKGTEVTYERLTGAEGTLLQMIQDNVPFTVRNDMYGKKGKKLITIIRNKATLELSADTRPYYEQEKRRGPLWEDTGKTFEGVWSIEIIKYDTMVMLQDMLRRGWVEVKTIETDVFLSSVEELTEEV